MNQIVGKTPQLGVNDETAVIVRWLCETGAAVTTGQVIAEIETTKAVSEVQSEGSGHIYILEEQGKKVKVGQPMYVLTATPDEPVDLSFLQQNEAARAAESAPAKNARWTKKAELLAHEHGIDIACVPAIGVVREADVLEYVKNRGNSRQTGDLVDDIYVANRQQRVLILGGGRGAAVLVDTLGRSGGQRAVGILDDDEANHGKTILGVQIQGVVDKAAEMFKQDLFDAAVISFTNNLPARRRVFEKLRAAGVPFCNVIHSSVLIHSNVKLGTGNVILANCRLGLCASVGDNNFLSAFINLDHHNTLGSHCTFGPGVMTSSRVQISDACRFGTGIFIEPGVTIGESSIIASGCILTRNIPPRSIVKTKADLLVRERNDLPPA